VIKLKPVLEPTTKHFEIEHRGNIENRQTNRHSKFRFCFNLNFLKPS